MQCGPQIPNLTSEAVVASDSPFLFVVRTSDFSPVSLFWKFLTFSETNGMIFSETNQFFCNEGLRGCFEASEAKKPPPAISLNVRRRYIRSVPCYLSTTHFQMVRLVNGIFLKNCQFAIVHYKWINFVQLWFLKCSVKIALVLRSKGICSADMEERFQGTYACYLPSFFLISENLWGHLILSHE